MEQVPRSVTWRSLIKTKLDEFKPKTQNGIESPPSPDIVKLPGAGHKQRDHDVRFKSTIKPQEVDQEENEAPIKRGKTILQKVGSAVGKILDFFAKLRLIGQILLTVYVIGIVTMMIVISAGSAIWEIASDECYERLIELLQDEAHVQVNRLGENLRDEQIQFFDHYLTYIIAYQIYVNSAFLTPPKYPHLPIQWSSEIVFTDEQYSNQDRQVVYDYPVYHSAKQGKVQTVVLYTDIVHHFKNLHPVYVNLPRLGGYNLFVGDSESGILQLYPGAQLSDDFNFETREWYWKAVEQQGEIVLTSPYYDAASGNLVITISKALYDQQGNLKRVIGIDFSWQDIINSINLGNPQYNAFAFMTTSLGVVISYPDIWKKVDGPYVIYLQTSTGFTQELWQQYKNSDVMDIEIPTNGTFTCFRQDLQIVGTLFYLGTCYEKGDTSKDYEESLEEYRGLHIAIDSIVFFVFCISMLALFLYYSFHRLNQSRREIKGWTLDMMKYSIEPQLFGSQLYSQVQVKSKTELMTRFRAKLEDIRQTELENLHYHEETWTRPINHFKYKEFINDSHPINRWNCKAMNQLRELNKLLPMDYRGNVRQHTIINPGNVQFIPKTK